MIQVALFSALSDKYAIPVAKIPEALVALPAPIGLPVEQSLKK